MRDCEGARGVSDYDFVTAEIVWIALLGRPTYGRARTIEIGIEVDLQSVINHLRVLLSIFRVPVCIVQVTKQVLTLSRRIVSASFFPCYVVPVRCTIRVPDLVGPDLESVLEDLAKLLFRSSIGETIPHDAKRNISPDQNRPSIVLPDVSGPQEISNRPLVLFDRINVGHGVLFDGIDVCHLAPSRRATCEYEWKGG